jgi:hypothetical protein
MTKRIYLLALACAFSFACAKAAGEVPNRQSRRFVSPVRRADYLLAHRRRLQAREEQAGVTDKGYYYASNKFSAPEHGGTHIDAPRHFSANGNTLDQLPLEQLMGSAILIDVDQQCEANRDYLISVEDFSSWEKQHGQIPAGSIVLLRTGLREVLARSSQGTWATMNVARTLWRQTSLPGTKSRRRRAGLPPIDRLRRLASTRRASTMDSRHSSKVIRRCSRKISRRLRTLAT